jgi:hypothetical protein
LVIGRTDRCAIGVRRRLTEEPDANRQRNIQKVELHDRQTRSPDNNPGTWLGRFIEKELSLSRVLLL